jgi:dTDP-4-amino-4,6-dideoxygalactose transaminase
MRIRNHGIYRRELAGVAGIVFQEDEKDSLHVHWMNTVKLEPKAFGATRDELVAHLKERGVEFIRLDDYAKELRARRAEVPVRDQSLGEIDGRSGLVAVAV